MVRKSSAKAGGKRSSPLRAKGLCPPRQGRGLGRLLSQRPARLPRRRPQGRLRIPRPASAKVNQFAPVLPVAAHTASLRRYPSVISPHDTEAPVSPPLRVVTKLGEHRALRMSDLESDLKSAKASLKRQRANLSEFRGHLKSARTDSLRSQWSVLIDKSEKWVADIREHIDRLEEWLEKERDRTE